MNKREIEEAQKVIDSTTPTLCEAVFPASPTSPSYRKVEEGKGGATKTYMIVCDEGWRESIVCCGMYEWAADWLLPLIGNVPYAPQTRKSSEGQ